MKRAVYRLKADVNSDATFGNCQVTLGHRTEASLTNSFSGNMVDFHDVYRGEIQIESAKEGDWVDIPFNSPFFYDGKRKLVYDMSCGLGTETITVRGTLTDAALRYPSRRAYHTSSNTEDTAEGVGNYIMDFRLGFE